MPRRRPGVAGMAWMRPARCPGSVRVFGIDSRVLSVHAVLDVLIDHAGQLLATMVVADDFVAGGVVLANSPDLDDVVVLTVVEGLYVALSLRSMVDERWRCHIDLPNLSLEISYECAFAGHRCRQPVVGQLQGIGSTHRLDVERIREADGAGRIEFDENSGERGH